MKKVIIMMAYVLYASVLVAAQSTDPNQDVQVKRAPDTYVLIVSGVNKAPEEIQSKDRAVLRLRKFFLNKAEVKADRLKVLVDEDSFARKYGDVSNAENLKKTFEQFAALVKPSDRFIFYYVGQANIAAGELRINLPGKDITHNQLINLLNQVKVSSMLIILDCPRAGLAIKPLAGASRIIVAGSRADQPYSTRFSDYFVPALDEAASDTNMDGRISLLEAFTLASKKLDDLYREQDLLKTETAILEDNGDGIPTQQPWRYEKDKNDGLIASKFFFCSEESARRNYDHRK